jgi:hypothetical protein
LVGKINIAVVYKRKDYKKIKKLSEQVPINQKSRYPDKRVKNG